jgi:hypothetical protein
MALGTRMAAIEKEIATAIQKIKVRSWVIISYQLVETIL